jgi:hypothetical protein
VWGILIKMADQLPINFAVPQEGAIASYDFEDIIDGSGYLRLYATRMHNDGTYSLIAENRISPFMIHSATGYVSATATVALAASPTYTTILNLTFNSAAFNFPRILNGTARLQLPISYNVNGASIIRNTITITNVTTSETIASDTWSTTYAAPASIAASNIIRPMTISNKRIAPTNQIRINIVIDGTNTAGAVNGTATINFDPLDRAGVADTFSSQLILEVPVKVEL